MDTSSFHAWNLYITRLQHEEKRAAALLIDREERREEVQASWMKASRKKKVLENLRDKQKDEYYHDQRRHEFNIMNELNTSDKIRINNRH